MRYEFHPEALPEYRQAALWYAKSFIEDQCRVPGAARIFPNHGQSIAIG